MANRVPCFFYAPTWDFPPEGPIKLGNVLGSLKAPELPLHTASLPADNEMFSVEKRQVQFSYEKLREGRFSIFTRFMSFLGVGIDAGIERSRGTEETLAFDLLETTQFIPSEKYLRACAQADTVRRFLEKSRYRKPIYVITGLKIVKGAKAKSLRTSSRGGGVELEVDGIVWSGGTAPVSGGPGLTTSTSQTEGISWAESSDFVLAYRVRKITVGKMGAVKRHEDYTAGAMLGDNAVDIQIPELGISVDGKDVIEGGDGFVAEEVTDGEASVTCCYAE